MEERRVLERAAALGIEYLESLDDRSVRPVATIAELRQAFDVPLPDGPTEPLEKWIRAEFKTLEALSPPPKFSTMEQALAERIAPRKFTLVLLAVA